MEGLARWKLNPDVHLYDWQKSAINAFPENHRGVAKIVTGAGKTLFAIALAIMLQERLGPCFRILIVVPTRVLQEQWLEQILRCTNIDISQIGLLGNGLADGFNDKRIVIAVINSALRNICALDEMLGSGPQTESLMILDECHRYRGQFYSQILRIHCSACLGLSATPNPESYWPLVIADNNQRIGDLFFEYSYQEAVRGNCVSDFGLVHVGFNLSYSFRQRYDAITRQIEECCHVSSHQMLRYVGERLKIVYENEDRIVCARSVLEDLLRRSPEVRVLAFHERISSIDYFVSELRKKGIRAAAVHSGRSGGENNASIMAFRTGDIQVLVAGKSLEEGFDIPAADVGLIISSTTSPVRTIQTIGRFLRRKDGRCKTYIYRLYAKDTVDEKVFARVDFQRLAGFSENIFRRYEVAKDGGVRCENDEDLRSSVDHIGLTKTNLSAGGIIRSRPYGFYFSQQSPDHFVLTVNGVRYTVLNQDEMRSFYVEKSLKKGDWYYCTDRGMVLYKMYDQSNHNRWCFSGVLDKGFLIKGILRK